MHKNMEWGTLAPKATLTINGHLWPASLSPVEEEGPSGQSSQTYSNLFLQNQLSLLPGWRNENQSEPFAIPYSKCFPVPALSSEQPGWRVCTDSIGCVRVCVYSSYEGLSVWLWKSVSWPSSWHSLLQNASVPIGIYAVNIRLENPDLSTIQMTLFSLKSSINTFILWIYTLMEPQNPILNLNGGLYISLYKDMLNYIYFTYKENYQYMV